MDKFNDGADVDDILVCSWGYDQTNVDYYEVTGISASAKSVTLRRVAQGLVSASTGADYVAPLAGQYIGEPMRKTLRHYNYGNGPDCSVSLNSYSSARLWDCRPKYQTASGWGH